MGTHGFYCFRHKGLYYVIYNHWDSYPEGLGATLVNQLRNFDPQDLRKMIDNTIVVILNLDEKERFPILTPNLIETFRKIIRQDPVYLESIRLYYEEFKEETMDDASMFYEWLDHNFNSQEEKWSFIFDELFSNQTLHMDKALSFGFLPVKFAPNIYPPENIEWTYVIDLDNESFSVQGDTVVEFNYHNIPRNWIPQKWLIKYLEDENGEDVGEDVISN